MSLYHETAAILSHDSSGGGNLRTRIFGQKDLKSSPVQVYALALETSKWSMVLCEVIENAQVLKHERKLSPLLCLLLVHDFLLAKKGIALPSSHGLRSSIERHKARLTSEFTRTRIRRKAPSLEALRAQIESACCPNSHPRWVRVNTLKSTLKDQLETTFIDFSQVNSIADVLSSGPKLLHIDEHVPDLVAISPSTNVTKTEAYRSGAIILQDKASCFPAYLLDPCPDDGHIIDACAAPGNKTTHLAAILQSHRSGKQDHLSQEIFAFEKDELRAGTLKKMVGIAGSGDFTCIHAGQDFLKVDPNEVVHQNVGALLLDPSCSGSGIVGRDAMPELQLPTVLGTNDSSSRIGAKSNRKRKREDIGDDKRVVVDDDGQTTVLESDNELNSRLEALSSFQLKLLLHAFKFPGARKVTYSTCSVHAEENERVVLQALASDIAKQRGWRILERKDQVQGLRQWPVRGTEGDGVLQEACIRAYRDDGRGVMGFFVAAFVRDRGEIEIAAVGTEVSEETQEKKSTREQPVIDSDDGEWAGFED